MKTVRYEEEGVATAVGMIFAMLIVALLLSLFVTSYVPAEMSSFEEQYSSNLLNDMIEVMSTISLLSLNANGGQTASVAFNLQSSYVPIFSSPTTGLLSVLKNSPNNPGYIYLNNSSFHLTTGGAITVLSNNMYYVNEVLSYEFSSILYQQEGSPSHAGSVLQYGFIKAGLPTPTGINLTLNLINILGGPIMISGSSPFSLSIQMLSETTYIMEGNFGITLYSPMAQQVYNSTISSLSSLEKSYPFLTLHKGPPTGNETQISVASTILSEPITLHVTYTTVLISVNS